MLRVATYNVRGLRDSVPALVRVIESMRADVLCLQEAPRFLNWRGRRRELAQTCGLRVAAGGRLGGVAVLVRPGIEVLAAEHHALKVFLGLEIRGLAVAILRVAGVPLAVGSIHLDLHRAARLRHAYEAMTLMRRAAGAYGAAIVIGGDLNEQETEPTWRYLAGQLADCHPAAPRGDGLTFPARQPRERIDAVFAARSLTVVSCGGADASETDLGAATDHLPVLAELRVGP
ncbi:endonuclease/exonuclease/phosphatase family protein [Nonomuraea sp. NPDC049269]|uniref:endonuclease/exonuclease/phosphatase family protein n=1 Tax=Nonomuraea sp. NPDC049269 TaxID=3364349 RepID=UPI003717F74D